MVYFCQILLILIRTINSDKYLFVLTEDNADDSSSVHPKYTVKITMGSTPPVPFDLYIPNGVNKGKIIVTSGDKINYKLVDISETATLELYPTSSTPSASPTSFQASEFQLLKHLNAYLMAFKCHAWEPHSKFENMEISQCDKLFLLQQNTNLPETYQITYGGSYIDVTNDNFIEFQQTSLLETDFHPTTYAAFSSYSDFSLAQYTKAIPKYKKNDMREFGDVENGVQKTSKTLIFTIKKDEASSNNEENRVETQKMNIFLKFYRTDQVSCQNNMGFLELYVRSPETSKKLLGFLKTEMFYLDCFSHSFAHTIDVKPTTLDPENQEYYFQIFLHSVHNKAEHPLVFKTIELATSKLKNEEPNDEFEICAHISCAHLRIQMGKIDTLKSLEIKSVKLEVKPLIGLKTPFRICFLTHLRLRCKFETWNQALAIPDIDHSLENVILIKSLNSIHRLTLNDRNRVIEIDDELQDGTKITTSSLVEISTTVTKTITFENAGLDKEDEIIPDPITLSPEPAGDDEEDAPTPPSEEEINEYCRKEAEEKYPHAFVLFIVSLLFLISTIIGMIFIYRKYKFEVMSLFGIQPRNNELDTFYT